MANQLSLASNKEGNDSAMGMTNMTNRNATTDIVAPSEAMNEGELKRKEDSIVMKEWLDWLNVRLSTESKTRRKRRIIERVPALQRRDNMQEYNPLMVSFGPYHHGKKELQLAEDFKVVALRLYITEHCRGINKVDLYDRILEVTDFAISCYAEEATTAYSKEKFAEMMLRDGCLILLFIDWLSTHQFKKLTLFYEHLGMSGIFDLYRDLFLLENQLPYRVLEVLMSLSFDKNKWEGTMNLFMNMSISGEWSKMDNFHITISMEEHQQPLHLLEIFRTSFLLNPEIDNLYGMATYRDDSDLKNYIHSFRSVTDLKAKGIRVMPSDSKSKTDIKFTSHQWSGKLEFPPVIVDRDLKCKLLNLIAYEMSPHNPNDFRVTSYATFLKSLINHRDDVKELRTNKVLLINNIGDDEVVNMFKEANFPRGNLYVFAKVQERIQNHYNSKAKTWIAELISRYFNSPWNAIAFFVGIFLLVLSTLQTYFTIYPHSKNEVNNRNKFQG